MGAKSPGLASPVDCNIERAENRFSDEGGPNAARKV